MATDWKKVPFPPSPRVKVHPKMTPAELSEAVKQIDAWTRETRAFLEALRDAVIRLEAE